jgi:hypothetical protein
VREEPAPSPPIAAPAAAITPLLRTASEPPAGPEALAERALALSRSGVPIPIETRLLSPTDRERMSADDGRAAARSVRVAVHSDLGRYVGFRLDHVERDSPLRRVGLRSGDVLLAVNGIELTGPWSEAELLPSGARVAVLELVRGGERRVTVVRW